MRLQGDLDGGRLPLMAMQAHLSVYKTHEALHAIQNRLNL
jgi:hypothetical protein